MDKSTGGLSLLFFDFILELYDPSSYFFFFLFDIFKLFFSFSLSFELSEELIIVISDFSLTFLYCFRSNI